MNDYLFSYCCLNQLKCLQSVLKNAPVEKLGAYKGTKKLKYPKAVFMEKTDGIVIKPFKYVSMKNAKVSTLFK